MKYRLICELHCRFCSRTWIVDDREIEGDNEETAIADFKLRYQLCPRCFGQGRRSAVSFDDRIYPEVISE
jgi:hypothetical protein